MSFQADKLGNLLIMLEHPSSIIRISLTSGLQSVDFIRAELMSASRGEIEGQALRLLTELFVRVSQA